MKNKVVLRRICPTWWEMLELRKAMLGQLSSAGTKGQNSDSMFSSVFNFCAVSPSLQFESRTHQVSLYFRSSIWPFQWNSAISFTSRSDSFPAVAAGLLCSVLFARGERWADCVAAGQPGSPHKASAWANVGRAAQRSERSTALWAKTGSSQQSEYKLEISVH